VVGAVITWFLLTRREQVAPGQEVEEPAEEKAEELVGAGVGAAGTTYAAPPPRPEPAESRQPAEHLEPVEPFDQEQPEEPAERAKSEKPAEPEVPAEPAKPVVPAEPAKPAEPVFSRRMDISRESEEPTLFDDPEPAPEAQQDDVVPAGRYGAGSADAVPHQGPPDGFTIKGNAQSMLFHTPDSPYYGRTKPEVWFRTEADAERAGFSKYVRKPRKSQR
jgi:hypothetical protein